MEKIKLTYDTAIAELQAILTELEDPTVELNMNNIKNRIKRTSELMAFCKKQLCEIDEELEKTMEML